MSMNDNGNIVTFPPPPAGAAVTPAPARKPQAEKPNAQLRQNTLALIELLEGVHSAAPHLDVRVAAVTLAQLVIVNDAIKALVQSMQFMSEDVMSKEQALGSGDLPGAGEPA